MSIHPLGAIAPSSPPPPLKMTGAQAGLSGQQQVRLLLQAMVDHGGAATMAVFYATVEKAMAPHVLSGVGKAAVRCYVNRTCLKKGYVEADRTARQTALWQITSVGRALVAPKLVLVPKRPNTPNTTAKWLGKHLRPPSGQTESDLYRMMRAALCKRLPVSANADMIDDHIQNFMVRVIRRDAFAKMLADGGSVPYSKVVAYCVNSGRTDARDMGVEPVCREMFGARTEKERREQQEHPEEPQFGNRPPATRDTDGSFMPQDTDEIDMDFEVIWHQIENVVNDHKPQAWERYSGILAMKYRGMTTKEIAAAEGVSRNRAASMLAEARRCVRESYAAGDLVGFLA